MNTKIAFRCKKLFLLAFAATVCLYGTSPARGQTANQSSKGYIGVREFAEAQGISYQWFPIQKTLVLSKGNRTMHLTVGRTEAVVDDQPIVLPSAPILQGGQVMAPARSIINVFGSQTIERNVESRQTRIDSGRNTANEEENELDPDTPAVEDESPSRQTPVVAPPKVLPPSPKINVEPEVEEDEEDASILVAVRHSVRENETRVVLEFDGPVNYSTEQVAPNKFKLRISGCKNIIPTNRSKLITRDLKNVSFHSGADRKGLVINFELADGVKSPSIETVANPYRMVLTFQSPNSVTTASATASLTVALRQATTTADLVSQPAKTASAPVSAQVQTPQTKPEKVKQPKIDVPLEQLTRSAFAGRAIIIDPGHGGSDFGVQRGGLTPEKQITMEVAVKLRQTLRQIGFNAYLLRTQDIALTSSERLAATNKTGGDLVISLHIGGSSDESIAGIACYSFDTAGIAFDTDPVERLPEQSTFMQWAQTTRFDLARFLSIKIRDRMIKHLAANDRGVRSLPLLPLKFLIYPAVTIEMGMLTNQDESAKLMDSDYQDAIARSIANGIVDFFNGIRLNQ